MEIQTKQEQIEALSSSKKLLEAALQELKTEVDRLTRADDRRNRMEALVAIDQREGSQITIPTFPPTSRTLPTLKAFTEDLRVRIARSIPDRVLRYSPRDVRSFLGGLAMSRLSLLHGISGTGKTSLPRAFAQSIGGRAEVVEVQAAGAIART